MPIRSWARNEGAMFAIKREMERIMCDTVARRHSYAHIEYLPAQDTQPAAQ